MGFAISGPRPDSTAGSGWRDAITGTYRHPGWVEQPSPSTTMPPQERELPVSSRGTAPRAPDGGTGRAAEFRVIEDAVAGLAEIVPPEELEYGTDTPLVPALYDLVRAHGADAVLELAASIESNEMDPQLGFWILRWLGRLPDHSTRHARRWLLERALRSAVPMIRDGAALGLAPLADPRALPALRAALDRERYSRVRRNMERAVQQVERVG